MADDVTLTRPPADPDITTIAPAGPPTAAPAVPGYELLGEVGRGGMGVVYRARDAALGREVAVKLLADRYDHNSPTAARFLEEAGITAQLQHLGIPPVYQVGRLPGGRPFLAMKLVKGDTLDALLKGGTKLDPLAVFGSLAQAVGYAHAHGVIHRDLKPANVMVGAFGEVQVMDWGLAKVLDRTRPEAPAGDPEATLPAATEVRTPRDGDTPFTQHGSVLGTPAFMPPEQAAGELGKVDARSDVFGLGAILCVLLTGKPPFTGADAESVRLKAVRGQTDDAFARLDASSADPGVAALCKRCLAFDPADRPASGDGVAAEVAALRSAADERVKHAERDRHAAEVRRRVTARAAAAVAAVLLAGVVGTGVGLLRADAARRDAERSEGVAEQRRGEADEARGQAEAKAAEANAALKFVEDRVLTAARPRGRKGGLGKDATLRDAIAAAVPDLAAAFEGQPLAEARLRATLAETFDSLGDDKAALDQLERARTLQAGRLPPDHPDALAVRSELAARYVMQGRQAEGFQLGEEVLTARRKSLPAGHPDIVALLRWLFWFYPPERKAEAEQLVAETLRAKEEGLAARRRDRPAGDPDTIAAMLDLAETYLRFSRHESAVPLSEEALAALHRTRPPDHPDTLKAMRGLADVYARLDRLADATRAYEAAWQAHRRALPRDHPDTLEVVNDLAFFYFAQRRRREALRLFHLVLAAHRRVLPPDHPQILETLSWISYMHELLGHVAEALVIREEVLAAARRSSHPESYGLHEYVRRLADLYAAAGRHAEALLLREERANCYRRLAGPDDYGTVLGMVLVAESLAAVGRAAEAQPLTNDCLARFEAQEKSWRVKHNDTTGSIYFSSGAELRAIAAGVARAAGETVAAEDHADRAMTWLAKAVAADPAIRGTVRVEACFNPLRGRADFQQLMIDPPEPAPPPRESQ